MTQRPKLAGAISALSACLLVAAGMSLWTPTETPIGPLVRVLDSLTPWILGLAFCAALCSVVLGMRAVGSVLATGALSGVVVIGALHIQVSASARPELPTDLRVLFFNALGDNAAFGHRIFDAVLQEDPDIVIITEASAIYPALTRFRADYTVLGDCKLDDCEMIVAVRADVSRFWTLSLNPIWRDRYAVTELVSSSEKRAFVVGVHLLKPWLSGISESEIARLGAQFDWLAQPTVVVGDFNMTTWAKPMRDLLHDTGFKALRIPIPTWPSAAGNFGVPIDHVLVHNGAQVVSARPFGVALGSNHRGLVADIAVP